MVAVECAGVAMAWGQQHATIAMVPEAVPTAPERGIVPTAMAQGPNDDAAALKQCSRRVSLHKRQWMLEPGHAQTFAE